MSLFSGILRLLSSRGPNVFDHATPEDDDEDDDSSDVSAYTPQSGLHWKMYLWTVHLGARLTRDTRNLRKAAPNLGLIKAFVDARSPIATC